MSWQSDQLHDRGIIQDVDKECSKKIDKEHASVFTKAPRSAPASHINDNIILTPRSTPAHELDTAYSDFNETISHASSPAQIDEMEAEEIVAAQWVSDFDILHRMDILRDIIAHFPDAGLSLGDRSQ